MTDQQIIDGNELIHRFIHGEPDKRWITPKGFEPITPNYYSWDSIMPIVEKIEAIGQTWVEIGKKHCRIQPIFYKKEGDYMEHQLMHECRGSSKIEAVYSAVIQFINWYNNQQKQ